MVSRVRQGSELGLRVFNADFSHLVRGDE